KIAGTATREIAGVHDLGGGAARAFGPEHRQLRVVVDEQLAIARAGMNLRTGPLLRVVHVDAGPDRLGRLLLVAHHMVVDAVSWRIILDDLVQAYEGAPLPRYGRPFLAWATDREDRQPEPVHLTPAPLAVLDPVRDTAATAVHHTIELGEQATHALLTTIPAAHRATPDAGLLTALARAVARWRDTDPHLLVALESHGRTDEVAQTVGWFTAISTARVRPDAGGVKLVKEELRRDLDATPQLAWNYLGRFTPAPQIEAAWQVPPDADPLGSGAGDMPLPYPLMINALERDGRLGIRFTWPAALFTEVMIAELGGHFQAELEALAVDPAALTGGLTPSDVPLVDIDQAGIEDLERRYRIADLLPRTVEQDAMIRQTEIFTVQAAFTLRGDLDVPALQVAAEQLLRRHPHLAAAFPADRRVQVIPADPRPDFRVIDTTNVAQALIEDQDDLLRPETGPMVRITVLRTGAADSVLVIGTHHAVGDGWSAPRMLDELFALYAGRPLPEPVPLRRYLEWFHADRATDREFWRAEVAELPPGDYLTAGRPYRTGKTDPVLFTVDADVVGNLTRAAAGRGLTANTVLQGAWANVLARHSGRDEVCFGTSVSGRQAEVDGIEELLGLVRGNVPVRVRLTGDTAADLAELQTRQQTQPHPVELSTEDLFDSLLVFENYPVDPARIREPAPGLTIIGARFRERTPYPVSLFVVPENGGWSGILHYQGGMFTVDEAQTFADELQAALRNLIGELS
ncbi:non-ribosomal peptide synthetase, partial [Pseudonocardiaceae bacterium YIM PH 21723]